MLEVQRFGLLEPIRFFDIIRVGKKKKPRRRWLYQCKCGRKKPFIKSQVEAKSARRKSCGECGYSAHKARLTCIKRNKHNHPTKTHPHKSGFQKFNQEWKKSLELRIEKYGPTLSGGNTKGKIFIPDFPNRKYPRGGRPGRYLTEEQLYEQFYQKELNAS